MLFLHNEDFKTKDVSVEFQGSVGVSRIVFQYGRISYRFLVHVSWVWVFHYFWNSVGYPSLNVHSIKAPATQVGGGAL